MYGLKEHFKGLDFDSRDPLLPGTNGPIFIFNRSAILLADFDQIIYRYNESANKLNLVISFYSPDKNGGEQLLGFQQFFIVDAYNKMQYGDYEGQLTQSHQQIMVRFQIKRIIIQMH